MIRVRVIGLVLLTITAGWFPGVPARAQSEAPAGETVTLPFFHAPWSAEVLGRSASGLMGWLEGPDGSLRLELGQEGQAAGPDFLLAQSGEGWAVILGPDQEGTVNAWGREWQGVEPGLGQLVRAAVDFLSDADSGPSSQRIQLPDLVTRGGDDDPARAFRRDLVRRGRGRGGAGEIVVLTRLEPDRNPPWAFTIRSTRRPGKVRLGLPKPLGLDCAVPEVFVPIWPLSTLTVRTEENPGTSPPDEG